MCGVADQIDTNQRLPACKKDEIVSLLASLKNVVQTKPTGVAILPVLFVLRAATADDVQHKDEHSEQGADRDGHVERIKVAVDVSFEVGILQICGTFVYR